MKQEKEINNRYYVEYIDHWNKNKQSSVYLFGKNPFQVLHQMSEYEIIMIDQTD